MSAFFPRESRTRAHYEIERDRRVNRTILGIEETNGGNGMRTAFILNKDERVESKML